MSSQLIVINWTAQSVTPNLNGGVLGSIPPTEARFEYFPYQDTTLRDPSDSGKPGQWGRMNDLLLTSGGTSVAYNNLADPSGSAPNIDLLLWIFPDFILFSQLNDQLGKPIDPG